MRIGSIAATIAAAIVAVALIAKDRLTGPAPAPVAPVRPPRPEPSPAPKGAAPKAQSKPKPKPKAAASADDLSEINGIGPVYKTKLAKAGIASFADLARADATELAGKIEAPVSRIQAWIDAARRRNA
jgi:predicted flap endonuclease-1-like 5' DNA nuclease